MGQACAGLPRLPPRRPHPWADHDHADASTTPAKLGSSLDSAGPALAGVSAKRGLRAFAIEAGAFDMAVQDVVENVVKPRTEAAQTSLVDSLASDGSQMQETRAPLCGPSSAFLIYSRAKHTLGDLVSALESAGDCYVWVDFASLNLHVASVSSVEENLKLMDTVMHQVGEVLVVGFPWAMPACFLQAFTLRLLSFASNLPVRMVMPEEDTHQFMEAITTGQLSYEVFRTLFGAISVDQVQATNEAEMSSLRAFTPEEEAKVQAIARHCWAEWMVGTVRQAYLEVGSTEATLAWNSIGAMYKALGRLDLALPFYQLSVDSGRIAFGGESNVLAACCCNLAAAMSALGEEEAASVRANEALSIFTRVLGPDHVDTITARAFCGSLWHFHGRLEEAKEAWLGVVTSRRRILGDSAETATALTNLAAVMQAMGDLIEATPLLQESLAMRERLLGKDSAEYATSLHNLGLLFHAQGMLDDALPRLERALEIRSRVLGPSSIAVAQSLTNLGALERNMGRLDAAREHFEKALGIFRNFNGALDHTDVAGAYNNVGIANFDLGNLDEALEAHGRALAMRTRLFGEEHPDVAQSLCNLARVLAAQGKLDKSREMFEDSLIIRRISLGADHASLATCLDGLSAIAVAQNDLFEAKIMLERALEIRRGALGNDNVDVAKSLTSLASVLHMTGNDKEALQVSQEASAIAHRVLGHEL